MGNPGARASGYAQRAQRWRVPLHFLLAVVLVVLARPTPRLLVVGAVWILLGLSLRAWAAGHLRREAPLVTTGPYAYVRHPLYLGTALLLVGFAVASGRWSFVVLVALYFLLVFLPVMRREEFERRARAAEAYADYAARVPVLFPYRKAYRAAGDDAARFSTRVYGANREWRAAAGCALLWLLLGAKLLWG